MEEKEAKKTVKIFYKDRYKYEGILISEDETTYTIDDIKEGIVRLPKSSCVLKEGRE